MKRKFFLTLGILLSVCMLQFTSCSGLFQPSPDEVMQKINSDQELEKADYNTMLDYVEEFVECCEASDRSYEAGQEAGQEYPYFVIFAAKLDNAPAEITNDPQYKDVVSRFLRVMR